MTKKVARRARAGREVENQIADKTIWAYPRPFATKKRLRPEIISAVARSRRREISLPSLSRAILRDEGGK